MTQSLNPSAREVVAAADRLRRARVADRALLRLAPAGAAAALLGALAGRFAGWPAWVGPAVLGAAVVVIGVGTFLQRRSRTPTDAIASAVDRDAGLAGELRSAHWFESEAERDPWVEFHLSRALARATQVDWKTLYPAVRGGRQWAGTAIMALLVVGLAVRMPAKAPTRPIFGDAELAAALPAELQDKLAKLMAQLEAGAMDPEAKQVSLAELKELMAKLDPALQKKLAEMLEKQALGQDANTKRKDLDKEERADRAENSAAGLPEDVRWALEDMAAKMAQASQEQRQTEGKNPSASSETGEQGMGSAQAEQKQATMENAAPMVREAASDPGGKMMMGGGGPMGGDSRPGAGGNTPNQQGAAEAILLAQALRKELLEASADALGENVDKEDLRKKTEQGKSTLGYTRVAPPSAYEPSRSTAPPPVPEARRSLLLNYFIRK